MNNNDFDLLRVSIIDVQNNTIGLFRARYIGTNEYVPVVEEENGVLTIIEIGTLMGMQITCIGADQGHYVPFPDGKSLTQMMDNPMEFNDWYKQNCK